MSQIQLSLLVLGGTGLGFSLLLAFLSKKLKVEEDPRVEKIEEMLPGINCGACGFSGCRTFAEATVAQNKIFSGCIPGGEELNKKIIEFLGLKETLKKSTLKVVCHCGAKKGEKKSSSLYRGPATCQAANLVGGRIDCFYGCLGLEDCVRVCPTEALCLNNNKIDVDIERCIGCGRCVKACPRNLLELVSLKEGGVYYVACANKEKGPQVRKVCSRGCIACGICVRVEGSPFYLKDNLSYLDYSKALKKEPQKEAQNKCPTRCIFNC